MTSTGSFQPQTFCKFVTFFLCICSSVFTRFSLVEMLPFFKNYVLQIFNNVVKTENYKTKRSVVIFANMYIFTFLLRDLQFCQALFIRGKLLP